MSALQRWDCCPVKNYSPGPNLLCHENKSKNMTFTWSKNTVWEGGAAFSTLTLGAIMWKEQKLQFLEERLGRWKRHNLSVTQSWRKLLSHDDGFSRFLLSLVLSQPLIGCHWPLFQDIYMITADFVKYIQTLWVSERMMTTKMSPQDTDSFSII